MYTILWKYKVASAKRAEFETVYGTTGLWYQYFKQDPDYLGSFLYNNELAAKPNEQVEYILIDKWTSKESYEHFKKVHQEEYEQLGKKFELLYAEEIQIGAFHSQDI